ncbi:hypothetical protein M758_UG208300 [Ceratodon purpureus]|nr:hypothetical protein M758_UG208300 [Ceratodon purpureus]
MLKLLSTISKCVLISCECLCAVKRTIENMVERSTVSRDYYPISGVKKEEDTFNKCDVLDRAEVEAGRGQAWVDQAENITDDSNVTRMSPAHLSTSMESPLTALFASTEAALDVKVAEGLFMADARTTKKTSDMVQCFEEEVDGRSF